MRSSPVILLLAIAPTIAIAAPCRWEESGIPPLRVWKQYVLLQRAYSCPHDAFGVLQVDVTAKGGGARVTVGEAKAEVSQKGKWLRKLRLLERFSMSATCNAKPGKRPRHRLIGIGRDQRLVYDVSVRAKITGTDDMKSLSWEGKSSVACTLCPNPKGDFALKEGRANASSLGKKTRIVATASRAWFDCAKDSADLSLRFFSERHGIKTTDAIRPDFVLSGLEKKFQRKGHEYSLEQPIPIARLCQAVGGGRHRLMWEIFGQGELMRMGHGGRSWINLVCP